MILDCSCAENMSKLNCYLCASDEGMLLDIFGDAGKAFRESIETCLSVKVKLSDAPSTKICHKCAYELESCDKFLAKYKRFGESLQEGVVSKTRGQCRLCGDTPKKLRLLRVDQGNSRKNLLDKLQHVSLQDRNSLKENTPTFSVCLDCRYNLDLLSDLKTIHHESVKKLRSVDENGQKLLDFPKIKTSVVKRKTTYIPEPKLTETSSWDSGASSTSSSNSLTMPLKRRRVRSVKESERTERTSCAPFRKCEECHAQVESGIDMYRYHRSGQTVCKDCWLTMDPEKVLNAKRKRLGSSYAESGTKLCAVFLKDVLSNPSKYSNAYKVEKDKDGNKTFLITDESSESDEKDRARPKRLRPRVTDSSSPAALETIPETRKAVKRPSAKESKTEQHTVKRGRPRGSDESVETSPVHVRTTRARNGLAVEVDSTIKTRSRRNSSESTTASTSLAPETEKNNPPTRRTARAAKNAAPKKISADEKSFESGSSSNESRAVSEKAKTIQDKKKKTITITKNKNQRASRRARSNSFTGSIVVISDEENPDGNSSEDSSMPLNSRKTKGPSKISKTLAKNAKSDSELDKPYTCSICQLSCKNTLVGKAHELTHEKQPKVELRRVVVEAAATTPDTNAEETPHEPSISKEDEKDEKNEKENSHDEKNGNAASAENPDQPMPANDKSENENIATPEESVSEEKPEASPVKEDPEDERTMKQNLDDQKENKEETQVPLEKETATSDETPEPVDKDESLVQETITDRIENDENSVNENKENDNSEEKLSKEKDDEASDKVQESSAESNEVEIEPPEVPIPRQHEPEETMDVTSTKETEETTANDENARTVDEAEPMEVTEAEEDEKNFEEKTENVVEHVEKAEHESCENDAKATEVDNEEKTEQGNEVDIPSAKAASETEEKPEVLEAVEKTPEVPKAVEEAGKDKEEENSNENDEEKEDEEESSTNHEQETAEKLTERDEEEKEATKLNGVETEREEKPEEPLDSSRDEKERDEQVSLVVEDSKENEQPIQQSEKENNEEKKDEHNEIKRIPEADDTSNESSIAASETLREVFDLANDEVKKRLGNENADKDKFATAETLENISIEIQSGSDMPSLELEAASTEKS